MDAKILDNLYNEVMPAYNNPAETKKRTYDQGARTSDKNTCSAVMKAESEAKKKIEARKKAIQGLLLLGLILTILTIFTIGVILNKVREDKKKVPDLVIKQDEKDSE